MSAFKNKNSLRTIEAEVSSKVKNNEARPKFTGSYNKKRLQLLVSAARTSAPATDGGDDNDSGGVCNTNSDGGGNDDDGGDLSSLLVELLHAICGDLQ